MPDIHTVIVPCAGCGQPKEIAKAQYNRRWGQKYYHKACYLPSSKMKQQFSVRPELYSMGDLRRELHISPFGLLNRVRRLGLQKRADHWLFTREEVDRIKHYGQVSTH